MNLQCFIIDNELELQSLFDRLKNYNHALLENLNYLDFCKTVYYNFY
jgi:hypothetical protein